MTNSQESLLVKPGVRFGVTGPHAARTMMLDDLLPLRHNRKPRLNITWEKDCGKNVESAPWFKVFKGDRINDPHLTLAKKRAAHPKG